MSHSRARYLIDQLIDNRLTGDELSELISSLGHKEMTPEYSQILELYFNELLEERDSGLPPPLSQ